VLDASTSTNILKVLGNNNDTVNALGFTKASGAETEGSITYNVYTHSGANTLIKELAIKSLKPSPLTSPTKAAEKKRNKTSCFSCIF
jgi:hypothetical protein